MIKNEFIKIKVHSKIISKLRNNGYNVNIGDDINIKISELSKNSHSRIDVVCDICFREGSVKYQDYNIATNNSTDTYYCTKCKNIKSNKTCIEKNIGLYNSKDMKDAMLKKYNVDNISKLDYIKDKKKETTLKNYGVDLPAKSEVVRDRMKKTCLEKYGVENVMYNEDIKEKLKSVIFNKYGVYNTFLSDEIKDKIKETFNEKYGVNHQMQVQEIFMKQQKSGFKLQLHEGTQLQYRGTYEKDFLDFCFNNNIVVKNGKRIKYFFENKDHYYFSDYYIESKNLIVEIKSSWTYNKYIDKNLVKQKTTIKNGYNYMFIIDKEYEKFIELF